MQGGNNEDNQELKVVKLVQPGKIKKFVCQENSSSEEFQRADNGEQEAHNGSEKSNDSNLVSVSESLGLFQSNGLGVHVAEVLAVVAKLEVASEFLHHRYCLPN